MQCFFWFFGFFSLVSAATFWHRHLWLCITYIEYVLVLTGRVMGHFRHETESPWPLHFKLSHWWKRRSRSKFAPHYARGTNGVCACKMDVKSKWIPTWHRMDHVSWSLDYVQKPPRGGRPNTKPWDHGTPNTHNRWFISILSCVRTRVNRNPLKWHLVEGPVTCDFTLQLRVHDHTMWFWKCWTAFGHSSFRLSQFRGHGSWLVCEVALCYHDIRNNYIRL